MGGADMGEGSWIGLDVHARSTVAAVIDDATGEGHGGAGTGCD
jgi:hypothetical protein